MKYNNELERRIMKLMINNKKLNDEIICLRIENMTLENERAELYNKVQISRN